MFDGFFCIYFAHTAGWPLLKLTLCFIVFTFFLKYMSNVEYMMVADLCQNPH
jgi:hypothetical protein